MFFGTPDGAVIVANALHSEGELFWPGHQIVGRRLLAGIGHSQYNKRAENSRPDRDLARCRDLRDGKEKGTGRRAPAPFSFNFLNGCFHVSPAPLNEISENIDAFVQSFWTTLSLKHPVLDLAFEPNKRTGAIL